MLPCAQNYDAPGLTHEIKRQMITMRKQARLTQEQIKECPITLITHFLLADRKTAKSCLKSCPDRLNSSFRLPDSGRPDFATSIQIHTCRLSGGG